MSAPPPVEIARPRMSRAAMVFGAVALAASAEACQKETIAQPYGAPPTPMDAGPPRESMVQPYGAPPSPMDAGVRALAPIYGMAPVMDAGPKKAP